MLLFEDLYSRILSEKFYTYKMPEDKSLTMYDFYVLDYLKFLLDKPSVNFRELPLDLKDSVSNAVKNLYPALREELLSAVLYAICAEFRHVESNRIRNRSLVKDDPKYSKLYKYWLKYTHFNKKSPHDQEELTDIYDVRKPSTKNRPPSSEKNNNLDRNQSYKAAQYAIEKSGLSTSDFVSMCSMLYHKGEWMPSYGGKAWGNICDGWLSLHEAEKIDPNVKDDNQQKNNKKRDKMPMSVAIDHIYDLQHNTDTVFNKLKSYYKDGYYWIKKALDDKANVRSYHHLLNKASGTVKAMALPILYNKLGQTWEKEMNIQKPVDIQTKPDEAKSPEKASDEINLKVGDVLTDAKPVNGVIVTYVIKNIDSQNYIYDIFEHGKMVSVNHTVAKSYVDEVIKQGSIMIKSKAPDKKRRKVKSINDTNVFKVGDIVKCINDRNIPVNSYLTKGQVYSITSVSPKSKTIEVVDDKYEKKWFRHDRFELVNASTNKPNQEFKIGDSVKSKDGWSIGKITAYNNVSNYSYQVKWNDYDKKDWYKASDLIKADEEKPNDGIKVGDLVKCIDNLGVEHLITVGKTYKVIRVGDKLINITSDHGKVDGFYKTRFIKVNSPMNNNAPKFKVGDHIIHKNNPMSGVIVRINKTLPKFPYTVKWDDGLTIKHSEDVLELDTKI